MKEQMTKSSSPRIGLHLGIAGGLHNALLRARELDSTALQIFSRNPRGWTAKPLEPEQVEAFKRVREETAITPVVIHVNYLVNLASGDSVIRGKSRDAFRDEVERGITLGANFLVVHPGSAKGACAADGVRTCAETLREACADLDLKDLRILIENTAGQGDCIGHTFDHLRDIIAACAPLNLGVCFDTAHAFAAGYDLRTEEGFAATLESLEHNVGLQNIQVVHFNDSRAAYNSRVDRHFHVGAGEIGAQAMRRVARSMLLAHAAFILETPQDELGDDANNLAALRSYMVSSSA
jgi:deoxyribonuclease-4